MGSRGGNGIATGLWMLTCEFYGKSTVFHYIFLSVTIVAIYHLLFGYSVYGVLNLGHILIAVKMCWSSGPFSKEIYNARCQWTYHSV